MNNQINKYIIKTKYNDAAIINTAIELSDDERNVINKPKILQRAQLGKVFITATHKRNNNIKCDGKYVQFKNKPSLSTYQKHDNTPMLMYKLGAYGHYLSKKDRTKLGSMVSTSLHCHSRNSPEKRQKQTHLKNSQHR